jgi:Spy/CpxP family protein refolding chaperone
MKPKIIVLFLLIVSLLIGSGISLSAFPDISGHLDQIKLFHCLTDRSLFDGRLILKFKEEIQLTARQESQVEDLLLAFETVSIRSNAEIKIQELKFASRLKERAVDRQQIETLLREISSRKTDLLVAYIHYLFDLKEILTPEQMEKLKEIAVRVKAHIEERFKRRPDDLYRKDRDRKN